MEKSKKLVKIPGLATALEKLSQHDLIADTVKAVRQEAKKIKVFCTTGNGCVRLTMKPLVGDVDDWLGPGAINIDEMDFGLREYVYGIHPLGSHVIAWEAADGHTEPVNCYAYSSLKTGTRMHFSYSTPQMAQARLKNAQYYTEENGWSTSPGALLSRVYFNNAPILEFVVCVSGAKAEEDEICAIVGLEVANDTFRHYGFTVVSNIDNNTEPSDDSSDADDTDESNDEGAADTDSP